MTSAATQDVNENYQKQGDAAFQEGDLELASALYKQALEISPNDAWAEYSLAEVRKCQGKNESAVRHYTNSLELEPFNNSPFIQLLFTKVKPEQLNAVATIYQQLSASRPNNPWANVRLGDILTKQKKVTDAITSYKAASYKLLKNNYPSYVQYHWDSDAVSEPTYIVIGPMKTATSALYEYINQHPKVLPSIKKEIHFFNEPAKLAYGKEWYLSHFPPISSGSDYVTGEASPGYIVNHVHDTVFSMFPKAKIIALVRDPVARAFSHYTHNCKHGFERRSFSDAIAVELQTLELLNKGIPLDSIAKRWTWNKTPGYVLLGLYLHFLQQWYTAFPTDQILVISNQSLLHHPATTMQKVFSFLDLDEHTVPNYPKHNAGSYDLTEIPSNLKRRLQDFFQPYEENLYNFLSAENKQFLD